MSKMEAKNTRCTKSPRIKSSSISRGPDLQEKLKEGTKLNLNESKQSYALSHNLMTICILIHIFGYHINYYFKMGTINFKQDNI